MANMHFAACASIRIGPHQVAHYHLAALLVGRQIVQALTQLPAAHLHVLLVKVHVAEDPPVRSHEGDLNCVRVD